MIHCDHVFLKRYSLEPGISVHFCSALSKNKR
jgi:hypothetical protein